MIKHNGDKKMSCLQNDMILENLWEEHENLYRQLLALSAEEELSAYDEEFIEWCVMKAFANKG
jgi:hypothetical protein